MSRQYGFTLLEMLVAVALLALLGLAAALTIGSGIRSEQVVGGSIEALQKVQRAQQWLRRDLEQITARRGRTDQGDLRQYAMTANSDVSDNAEGVLLDFYRTGRRILSYQTPVSQLERVRYRLLEGRLYRDSSPYLEAPAHERWHEAVLMEQVVALKLRFYYSHSWHDSWPPLGNMVGSPIALPEAVEVAIDTERFGPVTQILLLPEGI